MSKLRKLLNNPSAFFRDSWLNMNRGQPHQTTSGIHPVDTDRYASYWEGLPLHDKIILYESFHGNTMSCSPLAIFKAAAALPEFKGYKHVWALNNRDVCSVEKDLLADVEFVTVHSIKYLQYLCKAKYLINNTTFPSYFIRKPGQIYLNTWHGTPLKTLGRHQQGSLGQHKNIQRNLIQATHILSQSSYMTNKLLGSHDLDGLYAGNVLELGYPRVDTTLSAIREDVRKKLTIDSEKPILLFAPTWRGEVGNVSGVNVRLVENLEHLCKALKDKYDIVYRGHVLEQKQIAQMRLPCRIVPDNIDTNELLAAVDYLITDYSSIFFDYLVQKKPVSLFVYDEEFYLKERGMYFGLEEIPAYKCKTISDLIDRVKHGDWSKDFSTTYETFRAKYLYLDDGRATQRTIDAIWHGSEEYVRKIDSQDKLNLVFYCGGFGSNGITSSALNLFSKFDYEKHNVILCESEYLDPEREYNLRRLNHNIKVFYRVGQSNTLPAEKKTLKDYYKTGRLGLKREQILRQHFGRERKRLLGDTRVDVTVDFCGYVKFWALLLSMNDISRKVIYQHNDMMAENDKMINGKYKHRNNFKVIFDSYRWFDRIVSVSKNTRDLNYSFFRSFVSRPDERFVHVTNAIDAKSIVEKSLLSNEVELKGQLYLYDESERAHDGKTLTLYTAPRRDFTNFIHIGRFSPEKRHDKLLTAFREVRAQKLNTMLYLLGSGPLYESTKRLASSLGVADSVVFLGQVKNPYALIAKCDCFVLASDHEGQPMVLLESLVLGKPVLATDIVGSRSVLENTGGKLVPNSVEGLVEGMMEFIDGKIPAPRFDHEKYQMETMALFYKEVCGRQ